MGNIEYIGHVTNASGTYTQDSVWETISSTSIEFQADISAVYRVTVCHNFQYRSHHYARQWIRTAIDGDAHGVPDNWAIFLRSTELDDYGWGRTSVFYLTDVPTGNRTLTIQTYAPNVDRQIYSMSVFLEKVS